MTTLLHSQLCSMGILQQQPPLQMQCCMCSGYPPFQTSPSPDTCVPRVPSQPRCTHTLLTVPPYIRSYLSTPRNVLAATTCQCSANGKTLLSQQTSLRLAATCSRYNASPIMRLPHMEVVVPLSGALTPSSTSGLQSSLLTPQQWLINSAHGLQRTTANQSRPPS